MEQDRFDSLAKAVAARSNRRRLLTGILGLGMGAAAGAVVFAPADAARRGFGGPKLPTSTPEPVCIEIGNPCSPESVCCSGCCVSGGGAPFQCVGAGICDV